MNTPPYFAFSKRGKVAVKLTDEDEMFLIINGCVEIISV